MEMFILCACDNITNSYVAHRKQNKTNRSSNQKKSHCVNELYKFSASTGNRFLVSRIPDEHHTVGLKSRHCNTMTMYDSSWLIYFTKKDILT